MSYLLLFLIGASVGSFLNVVIARVPEQNSVVSPRSRCPWCHVPIAWYDLVPVLSFFVLRGACRHCKADISVRYPIIELLCGGVAVALFSVFGLSLYLFHAAGLFFMLVAVSEVDRTHGIVPDIILVWAMAASIPGIIWGDALSPGEALLAAVCAGTVLFLVRHLGVWWFGKPGLGMGDVKLAIVLGLYLGWSVFVGLYLAVLLAGGFGIAGLIAGRLKRKSHLPFAPFIALGMVLVFTINEVLL